MKRKQLPLLVVFGLLIAGILAACTSQADPVVEERIVEVTRVVTETITEEGSQVEVTRETQRVVVETVVEEIVVEVQTEADSSQIAAQATAPPAPTAAPEIAPTPVKDYVEETTVNPFIDTEDDNLSTFAIDVDTAAYTLMRNYINSGTLPPQNEVRVEEYVNFFDQEYPIPRTGAFAIDVEGAHTPYGENDNYYMVRVGVQGYQVPDNERPDALLIFVVDTSGSMEQQQRLGMVKQGLRALLHNLRPSDRVGIIEYGSQARVVLEPTYVESRQRILDSINSLRTNGSTNAEQGIMLGYQMADNHALPGQITRLILNSDGVANVGNTTSEAILNHAKDGVSLSSFGYGLGDYNDTLMEQLANDGDGSYMYIDSREEAERVFYEELTGTIFTIAKDAKIQVLFNSAVVERYRLLGFENRAIADSDFRNDSVDAGEIGAGHSVTALYEVRLVDGASFSDEALLVQVRYEDPETGEVLEIHRSMVRGDFQESFEEASPRFQLAAVVGEYAEILRGSFWSQGNTMSNLEVDARRIAEYMPADSQVQEFARLVTEAARLRD